MLMTLMFAGGRSADPAAAGAQPAAGGAEPEEALAHRNPAEEQPAPHPAARRCSLGCAGTPCQQLPADLHLQVCHLCSSNSQRASFLPLRHSPHLAGQAEEGPHQGPAGPGRSGAGLGG